jgi:peptidase C13-like protein
MPSALIGALLALCAAFATAAVARAEPSYGSEIPPSKVISQLEHLAPQRPGTVDLYAIVVGGDGMEEVFGREVAQVRRVLEERFDAAGRIVTLVNSRASPEPEATLRSLAYALKGVAAKMDRDEDVLLLHLTTHGGSNHVLVLDHPQLELYGLSPRYLKALIDQSGIRYRVVVVSACYSGAFVQPLANPNALVITAANANRQSFGCGKKSPITEFSRAFYLEALKQTRSFPEAARDAMRIVHQTELAQGRKHSYPQMRLGAALEEPLKNLEQRLANASGR